MAYDKYLCAINLYEAKKNSSSSIFSRGYLKLGTSLSFFFSFFEYSRTYIFGLTVLCSGEVLCEKGKYQLVYRQLALSKDSFQQAQLHFQHALTGPDRTKERAILLSTLYLGARLLCVV